MTHISSRSCAAVCLTGHSDEGDTARATRVCDAIEARKDRDAGAAYARDDELRQGHESDQDSFHQYVRFDAPNSYFNAQGGSLRMSMPASIGAKLAAGSDRTVVNTVGDGTALFYPHSWWTTRKFDLPVLYIVTNNREYKTLQLGRQAIEEVYGWKPAGDDWYLRLEHPQTS